MAHFYLNIRDGNELLRDPDGYDFPTAQAARDAAVHSLREILRSCKAGLRRRQIEIADATGHAIAVVHGYDALPGR
jgi:hypothetical protein